MTLTAHIKGEVPYFKLKANVHVPALRREAFVRGLGTEEHLGGLKYRDLCKKIKDDVKAEVAHAAKFAEESNFPSADTLYTDNYSEPYPFLT